MPNRNDSVGLLVMYGAGLTDAQAIQECTDSETFMSEMYRATDPTINVTVDGDSHSVYWLSKLVRRCDWNLKTLGYEFLPLGVSGSTMAQKDTNYAGSIAIYYNYKTWLTKNILVIWAGTNDIFNGVAIATVKASLTSYVTKAHATGWTVVVIPTMVRDDFSTTQKYLDASEYTTWIQAGSSGADYVVAFPGVDGSNNSPYFTPRANHASDAAYKIACDALANNLTYFIADGVHLTEATGYKEWGDSLATTLLSIP